ncbi:unnamed protein product [Brachionus calyciflorus]|uniref:RING-type domain-containing protein n=1 Tax=Brachionus calyciflorus TaxID=104777 RepID=A0A814BTL2_9BILA|nr:unnamed protein product [Brachionus calyciflorus]
MQRSILTAISTTDTSPLNSLIVLEKVNKNGQETVAPVFYNCITALKNYENKSLEELRYEDYCLNRKYTNTLPPPFRPILNTPPISTDGTKNHKYKPVLGVDLKIDSKTKLPYACDTILTHICSMLEYENLSPEELRFYDYKNNLKFSSKLNDKSDKNNNLEESNDLASCPICLETIVNLKRNGMRLNVSICGHILCKQCTEQLTKNANNKSRLECPSCRKTLRTNEIHELFI